MPASLPPGLTRAQVVDLVGAAQPYGSRLVGFGDSYIANGGIAGATQQGAYGLTTWLGMLSDERLSLAIADNLSLSGTDSAQILATQIPAAVACNSPWYIAKLGTDNSYGHGLTVDQDIANNTSILSQLRATGGKVIVILEAPRTSGSYNAGLALHTAAVHNWLKAYAASRPGIIIIDPRSVMALSTGYGDPAKMQGDGIHPNALGARVIAQQVLSALAGTLPTVGAPPLNVFDVYNAVSNLYGNVISNGFMLTSGSAVGATGSDVPTGVLTGTGPQNWGVFWKGKSGGSYTGSLVSSLVSRSDGGPGQHLQIAAANLSGGNNTDYVSILQSVAFPASAAPGQLWEATFSLTTAATTGLSGAQSFLQISDGAGGNVYWRKSDAPISPWPQTTETITLKTPQAVIAAPAGGSARIFVVVLNIGIDTATAPANLTLKIGQAALRQVRTT